jgi:hypothetical protein
LALHCPTIVRRYELVEQAALEPARKARMLRYRDGLRSGEPIEVDDDMVMRLNGMQVAQSARYLYSAKDDFDFARRILERRPDRRTVETYIDIGEMGRPPPPRAGMPAGIHLIIFGPFDHCMLAIKEWDETAGGITARTNRVDLLAQVAADEGMLRAEIYVDGQVRKMVGAAMVERFGNPSDGWFRVVHRDPALRNIGP